MSFIPFTPFICVNQWLEKLSPNRNLAIDSVLELAFVLGNVEMAL